MLPAPRQHDLKYPSHGTRVTVRDLFGNIAVRVKQRVKIQESRVEQERAWLSLKRRIVELLLAWNIEVFLTLKDIDTQRQMKLRSRASGQPSRQLSLRYVQDILVQSSYLSDYTDTWIPLSASAQSVSIKGAISIIPRPSKSVQFISIGILPITSTSSGSVIYDDINRVFDLSSFGITDEEEEVSYSKEDRNSKVTTPADVAYRRSRRDLDRWPMFYFNINIKESDEFGSMKSEDFVSDKQLQLISKVLNKAVREWLSSRGYSVRSNRKRPHNGVDKTLGGSSISLATERSFGPIQPRKTDNATSWFQQPFKSHDSSCMESSKFRQGSEQSTAVAGSERTLRAADYTPVSGIMNSADENRAVSDKSTNGKEPSLNSARDAARNFTISNKTETRGSPLNQPTVDGLIQNDISGETEGHIEAEGNNKINDEVLRWIDPLNGSVALLDPCTGNSLPNQGSIASTRPNSQRLSLRPNTGSSTSHLASRKDIGWIQDFLKSWKNPVYEPSGLRIPKAGSFGSGNSIVPLNSSANQDLELRRLKRAALRSSNIVGQVDAKFILTTMQGTCPMPNNSLENQRNARIVVLVDQHAADERCIVEKLLAELYEQNSASESPHVPDQDRVFQIKNVRLMQPIRYEVSEEETRLFSMYNDRFSQWGISYETSSPRNNESNTSQVITIRTVPAVIAERCRSEPKLLIDLLRSEIWQIVGHGTSISLANDAIVGKNNTDHRWMQYSDLCPKGLIELINSRACRSAIMFNDVISHVDCVALIEKLARCSLPFQCAHGRPSMVPLIDLGWKEHSFTDVVDNTSNAFGNREMKFGYHRKLSDQDNFVAAYKKWRG